MRIKQFIFTLMVMFACSSFVAVAQDEPGVGSVAVEGSSVFDGEGTEQSPYIIDSSDKLIALRTNVNAGETYAGVYFKLASDIALSGEWTAIGNGSRSSKSYTDNAFKGVFDGDNNTISGLTITSTTAADAAIGLFGVVDGGTVKNLNLTNVNINVPSSNLAGAAIGMMLNKATADNITVSGAVVGNDGVGGIVGRMIINGTIANCTNNASVTTSYGGIGGIVGKPYYDNASDTSDFATITNCINNGTITAGSYAGGIAGLARANVTGCVNNGEIKGGTQTGGIIGQLIAAGTVSGNENKGKVSGTNHVGGIIGSYTQTSAYNYYNVTIANNINRGEIAATQQCAAILGVNNIDGFTAMTATGNVSHYYVEGLELFGNPEDMVIDETNKFVATAKIGETEYYSLQDALNAAAAGTGEVTVEIIEDVDLTSTTWAPVTVSGPGYPLVTVEGNEHTITGLTDMLFAATWAGKSGLIIKDLTIENSAIVNDENDANGNVGVGAFIGYPQASATITLENCHLKNSSVKGGHWTGGLIGMAGGYNGNDGPVFMNLTIKNCSVTDSEITGKGSAGALIGHGSCSAWTNVVIENTTVEDNTITSTGSSANKAGSVMGTIGAAGQPTTVNGETKTGGAYISAVVANNNVTSGGTEITTIYGRQGTETGMLYIVGGSYDKYPIEENVAYAAVVDGYALFEKADGTYGVTYLIVDGAGDYKFECENGVSATVENLTYTRTLASDGFNALFVPFGFSADAAPGFEFFKFDEACTANGELYLVVSPADYVNANAPYLVRPIGEGEEAKKLNIQISNATLLDSRTSPGIIEVYGEGGSIYTITGTYSQLKGAEDATIAKSYGISVNGYFALIGDGSEVGGTLGAFRFYMQLPEGANARNIGIRIGGESDDATGIVETENGKVKTEIYDLSGRRVQNAQKGIFIVNGKKVVK